MRRGLRPEGAAGRAGAGVHRPAGAARAGGREGRAALRARPRARARRRLGDRRAVARQLGDGRLRAARRRARRRRRTSVFDVAGAGFAGGRFEGDVGARECVRIMTGAVMPDGLDTVVPQEFVRVDGDARRACRPASCARGDNRRLRRRGPGARRGRPSPPAASSARPTSACSRRSAPPRSPVFRRLRVAFFSTGNELRSVGEPLDAGCGLRQQPLHALGHAAAARRRRARPRRRARRPGGARRRLPQPPPTPPTRSSRRAASASARPITPRR